MVTGSEHEKSTEELIFESAQEVFVQKGFDGARMQEIAEKAGINKALLHYYYRTKEKLFAAILEKVFKVFMPRIVSFIDLDLPVEEKIEFFVGTYVEVLLKNPFIPNFIINEINRNPDGVAELMKKVTQFSELNAFGKFSEMIHKEVEAGNIRPIAPEQLIVNMIGLCIFPFVARPIIQGVIFNNDKKLYASFLANRKTEVSKFIINSIIIDKKI